ncbi:MAG TPA: hypothetical protein VNL14_11025 [Candidatus Acidoferrales bacterium]|nr:hypothetical protein [Candidatus Acidoferrales bacterium]
MIDYTRSGLRCRAKRTIRSHAAVILPLSQGTIVYETENLGRRLILVQWDAQVSTYVFEEEIEILDRDSNADAENTFGQSS